MNNETRQAVIIGVNEYNDPDIKNLEGAVNDAKDVREMLSKNGGFTIQDHHFLTNEDASYERIRKAISDLLWQQKPCDLTLFYFSGHGFVDGYGKGYLAPSDMIKYEPFVYGIQIEELKDILLKSLNKTTVVVVLDCCYSGIATKGERSILNVTAPLEPYFARLGEEMEENKKGEGRIIIASSGETEKSRETIRKHNNGDDPHAHGSFSFHFIEGLHGLADPQDTGVITLDNLRRYLESQFTDDDSQKVKYYTAGASQLENIRLAIAPEQHSRFISDAFQSAETFINNEDPLSLIFAIEDLSRLINQNVNDTRMSEFQNNIDARLEACFNPMRSWLRENERILRRNYLGISRQIDVLKGALSFNKICDLDPDKKELLGYLLQVSMGNTDNSTFFKFCKDISNKGMSMKDKLTGTTGTVLSR